MALIIKVIGKTISKMALDKKSGLMDRNTRASTEMEWNTAKESLNYLINQAIRAIGLKI